MDEQRQIIHVPNFSSILGIKKWNEDQVIKPNSFSISYIFRKITRRRPILQITPRIPPINAEIPLVIHPQSSNGGGPRKLTGKHHENQKKRNSTINPMNTNAIDIFLVFPPLK